MNPYRAVFPDKHTILVAIHATSKDQMLRNILIAHRAQAHGVFLVNHDSPYQRVLIRLLVLQRDHEVPEGFWVGVNPLGLPAEETFYQIPSEVGGIWVDNAGVDERTIVQETASRISTSRTYGGWRGVYFGGVAHKYQRPVADVKTAAQRAMNFVDVITTTGEATGVAAEYTKVAMMREASGTHPLSLASGVSTENIRNYKDLGVDCFIVNTSISSSHTELDPDKVSRLVELVKS